MSRNFFQGYTSRHIHSNSKLALPYQIRERHNLKEGDKICLQMSGDKVLVKKKRYDADAEYKDIEIDHEGAIKLPPRLMEKYGWKKNSVVVFSEKTDDRRTVTWFK